MENKHINLNSLDGNKVMHLDKGAPHMSTIENPTPPDRSVEEIVDELEEIVYVQFGAIQGERLWRLKNWLRNRLTSLKTQGIEAGRREERERTKWAQIQIGECLENCQIQNGNDYCKNCGLDLEIYQALATIKHPNEPV